MTEPLLIDSQDNKGYGLQVGYREGRFMVTVTAPEGVAQRSQELVANYEPRWGIDVLDQEAIYAAADKLAKQLEEQVQTQSEDKSGALKGREG
jgi:hypothetical protein